MARVPFFVELACYKELEKEIATHSGNLAWRIPWTEEPGRLQSMGLQRVRHDWATITQRTESHPCKCLLASLSSVHTTQWVFQTIKIWLLTFWLTRTYWLFWLILRLKAIEWPSLQCVLKGPRTTAPKGAMSIQAVTLHQAFVLLGNHQNSTP